MKKRIIESLWKKEKGNIFFLNIAVFLVYFFFGKLGLSFAYVNPSTTALWAPTGIALASLLIFGFRVLPAIFLGAFFVNFTTTGGIGTSLGIALGNTLEGIIGAYFVNIFANGKYAFERVSDIFKFTFFAAILSTTLSANIGITTLFLGKLINIQAIWSSWLTWWLGDMGGNIIIAPLILVWVTHPRIRIDYKGIINLFASFLGIVITTEIVFLGVIPYPYICIPLAVWIAFWFGRKAATVTTLIVAAIAIFDTLHGMGPFAREMSINQSLILLQMFLSIFSLTGLTFAATVWELRKHEKTIDFQEKRFKALIEKSFDAVVLIDINSKILYASPSVKHILGYTSEEMSGITGFDLVVPEDQDMTKKELAKLALEPGGTVTVEYRTIRKDKKTIWVEATGTNLLLDPSVNAFVINFHDITEKKISEEKLTWEKETDEAMLSSIGEGIIATDNEGKIVMVNQVACDLLACQKKDLIGKSMAETIPMKDENNNLLPVSERPISKVLSLKKEIVTSSTIYYVRKNKTKFPVHFTVTPILLDRSVVGTIEVFTDITKEREIDKAKTEFVSVASHQLRTPLATINWYLEELMKNGKNLTEKQGSYLNEVYAASKRMVHLINALLDTSRLELGTFVVEPTKTDVIKIVKQSVKDLSSALKNKGVKLEEHFQKDLPQMNADPNLLNIIIQNLISNAVKYSKENGKIELYIIHKDKEFLFRIHDNGYGIPQSQQSKIFSKLFRADNARTIEPEGSGLGLYIVKSIITTSGGKISFESEENKGTTFYISFPDPGMQQKVGQKQLM